METLEQPFTEQPQSPGAPEGNPSSFTNSYEEGLVASGKATRESIDAERDAVIAKLMPKLSEKLEASIQEVVAEEFGLDPEAFINASNTASRLRSMSPAMIREQQRIVLGNQYPSFKEAN